MALAAIPAISPVHLGTIRHYQHCILSVYMLYPFHNLHFKYMIFLGEPADYDELVSMDAADATDSPDPHHVSMEEADRILNDDKMDVASSSGDPGSPSPTTSNPQTLISWVSNHAAQPRLDSTASSLASSRKYDTLPALYHSTAKAREAAFPPHMLGGGIDPLSYWRFGALPDDNARMSQAHI
jgi:hypothetical protein